MVDLAQLGDKGMGGAAEHDGEASQESPACAVLRRREVWEPKGRRSGCSAIIFLPKLGLDRGRVVWGG